MQVYRSEAVNILLSSKGDFISRWAFLIYASLISGIFLSAVLIKYPQKISGGFVVKPKDIQQNLSSGNLRAGIQGSEFVMTIKNATAIKAGQQVKLEIEPTSNVDKVLIETEVADIVKYIADSVVVVKLNYFTDFSSTNFDELVHHGILTGNVEVTVKKDNLFSQLLSQYKIYR